MPNEASPKPTTPKAAVAVLDKPVAGEIPIAEPTMEAQLAIDPLADLEDYVVLTAGITYRTGAGKDEVARFMRGARLRLHSTEQRVIDLIANKSIGKRGEKHLRSTPLIVFAAMGATDDPAEPPMQEVLPVVPDKGAPALV